MIVWAISTSAEYQRLRRQAQALEPSTAALLDRIGLKAGIRCLDAGLGNEAAGILRASGESQFDFVGGDIHEIGSIPGVAFDLIYARLVLIHKPNPRALLRAIYPWAKPGGYLVVQDYDFRTLDAYPLSEPIEALRRVFQSVFERVGLDAQIVYGRAGDPSPNATVHSVEEARYLAESRLV